MLSDVLSIARHKRYMVLDGVTQDAPEQKQIIQVISKKKVSSILVCCHLLVEVRRDRRLLVWW